MQINVHVSDVAPVPIETAFAQVTDMERFPEYFPGNLVIPAVTEVKYVDPPPTRAGSRRRVTTADGGVVSEIQEVFDPPHEHTYKIPGGFKPPGNLLFREAQGRWLLHPEGSGTRIDWHYSYTLTNPLAALLAWPVIGIFFRSAMRACLRSMCATAGR